MIEATKRDAFIDVCRGIAILMVITIHVGLSLGGLPPLMAALTQLGQLGVQLFFVASAYTLCESASRRTFHRGWVFGFFVRRWFRIAPLYYLAIPLYFAVSAAMARLGTPAIEAYTLPAVAANIAFVHGFVPSANNNIVPGGWSIGTEMAFYVTFPLLFWSLSRLESDRARGALALFAAVVGSAVSLSVASLLLGAAPVQNNSFYFYNLLNQMPVFLTGIAAYWWRDEPAASNAALTSVISMGSLGCGLALFYSDFLLAFEMLPIVVGVAFASMVLALRSIGAGSLILEYIGVRSFSIYIFHFLLVPQASKLFQIIAITVFPLSTPVIFILAWITAVIAATSLATMTEMSIERPFIKLGSKIAKFVERREVAA